MAAPVDTFGDNLFDVFDEKPEAVIPEKVVSKKAKEEESDDVEVMEIVPSASPKKRILIENVDDETPTASPAKAKKQKTLADTGEDLDPDEILPRIQIHKVETVEACIHEVAVPPNAEYHSLCAPTRKPAKEYPFILDPFQKEALLCIENNESVLVSAHTSAGKTVVAEYAVASSLRDKQRVIYTTPIKALSNQKYRELFEEFQDVGLMTGDVTINATASCLVMTTEILRSMLYRGSEIMREVAWVIFDEIHYMRDKERGVVWEETIILLPDNVHYVFLSATIPNARQFAEWICHLHHQPCHVVYTEYRPVPLQHYVFPAGGDGLHLVVDEKGDFREENFNTAMAVLKDSTEGKSGKKPVIKGETTCFKIVKMIMERNMAPVIVFSFSRKDCEGYALQMSKLDFNTTEEKHLVQEVFTNAMDALSDEDKQLPQVQNLLPLLKKGVGIHHSGLLPILKETIEILFAEGLLKALFATETFAMGLNMPARTVLFTSARKYDGKAFRWVTSGEYIQMSGRAGRRGLDEQGIVILMVDEKMSPGAAKQIIKGQPAELNSAFHLTYNMVLNLLRVEEINPEYMLEKSFYQFQNYSAIPALFDRVKTLEREYHELKIPQEEQIGTYYKIRQQLDSLGRELQSYITKPQYILPFLQPGRMVRVQNGEDDFDWGIVINFQQTSKDNEPDSGRGEKTYAVEVLVNLSKETANQNSVSAVKPCPAGAKGEMQVIPIMLHLITQISSVRLYFPKDLRSLDNRQSVLKSIQEVKKRFKDSPPLLDPIEDMGIAEKALKDCVKKIEAFEHRMYSHPLHNDSRLEELYNLYSRKVKIGGEIKAAKADLKKKRSLLHMDDLKCMKRVLRRMGYCTAADVIETKGRIACEISSSDELLLTELLFNGVFNDLNAAQTCSLMSCLVFQEKAKEMPKLSDQLSGALRVMQDTARRIARVSKEAKLPIEEQEYVEGFKPYLMDVIHAWCNGASFSQIMKMTSVFEGSIIRCMRRLEETLRQMMQAAKAIGNIELENKFAESCTKIKRDIAFAASLYL